MVSIRLFLVKIFHWVLFEDCEIFSSIMIRGIQFLSCRAELLLLKYHPKVRSIRILLMKIFTACFCDFIGCFCENTQTGSLAGTLSSIPECHNYVSSTRYNTMSFKQISQSTFFVSKKIDQAESLIYSYHRCVVFRRRRRRRK